MFDTERFIEECRAALKETRPQAAVRELVERVVGDPASIVRALGEPARAGVNKVYVADDLTILDLRWGPGMNLKPHDHRMWAVIGLYGGREENTFYRRGEQGLVRHGVKVLDAKEVTPLGETIIHSVRNPLDQVTAAIHVYGGNFFETPRSEWDAQTLEEKVYDVADTMRQFEESNKRLIDAGRG